MIELRYVIVSCDEAPAGDGWLSPHERGRLASMRVPKRRADFRGGRWAAKSALRGVLPDRLDFQEIDVRAAEDGSPLVVLPSGESPFAISIAHAGGRALAAVADRSVVFGADIEVVEPRSAAFVEDYFIASERAWLDAQPPALRDEGVTLLWSAKESALKAIREGLREDTREVEVNLAADALPVPRAPSFQPFHATVRSHGRTFDGIAARDGSCVFTMVAEAGSIGAIQIDEGAIPYR
ncbi:MAG: 4'-phosphopantetheinyl transferase superfamily protein [Polyangiaceae bacterium]